MGKFIVFELLSKSYIFDDLIISHASDAVSAYSKRFKCSSAINPRSAKYSKLIILFQYSFPKSKTINKSEKIKIKNEIIEENIKTKIKLSIPGIFCEFEISKKNSVRILDSYFKMLEKI